MKWDSMSEIKQKQQKAKTYLQRTQILDLPEYNWIMPTILKGKVNNRCREQEIITNDETGVLEILKNNNSWNLRQQIDLTHSWRNTKSTVEGMTRMLLRESQKWEAWKRGSMSWRRRGRVPGMPNQWPGGQGTERNRDNIWKATAENLLGLIEDPTHSFKSPPKNLYQDMWYWKYKDQSRKKNVQDI